MPHLQSFGVETDSLKEDEWWFEKRWWTVGLMEEHGWRNGHKKKPHANNGRDETVVWWVELVILHIVLLKEVQKNVVVQQIQYIAVCHGKTKFPQFTVFRNCGSWPAKCSTTMEWSMPLSWCRSFFPPFNKKKTWWNQPESFVKSHIACVVKTVLCGLRPGRKPRSMSSHLHHVLFSFNLL